MHLLRTDFHSLDAGETAVDLDQSPADVVFLSYSDSDLNAFAAAWEADEARYPSLRMANLAQLKHPFSIDLYIEKACSRAKFILVRLLGGQDYWGYGVEEFAALARAKTIPLAIVPGDWRADPRLEAASTLPPDDLLRIWAWFSEGGPENLRHCLAFVSSAIGRSLDWRDPEPLPAAALCASFARSAPQDALHDAPHVLLIFYRSIFLAGDADPIAALADALAARGCAVSALYVTSLKDSAAVAFLTDILARTDFDAIVNTTAFSGRMESGFCATDAAKAPVIQAILSNSPAGAWRDGTRGLGAADLAMNVVMPEIDGRLIGPAISFKSAKEMRPGLEFAPLVNAPEPDRVAAAADLALAWARLRRKPASARKIALVLSDYPHKGGRAGFAIGLDAPASAVAIAERMRLAGYDVASLPEANALIRQLEKREARTIDLEAYSRLFAQLPVGLRRNVLDIWGDPADDPDLRDGYFAAGALRARNLVVALQPERGAALERKSHYHDANLPPRHSYLAFYLWLRRVESVDALIHCGAHGTLEWLPGKAVALSADCAPQAALGPTPVIYPFIVNNPGEAAQAKRRIAAVTIGHLTPPLVEAGAYGEAAELEALLDEYAGAALLDPRRAAKIGAAILARARESGLAEDAGLRAGEDSGAALQLLDSWLCDVKDSRVSGALHVFGEEPSGEVDCAAFLANDASAKINLAACAASEANGLMTALGGGFVPPGPGGAPSRGRVDVLPTGRNIFSIDPRSAPTRTAWEIGRQAADEVLKRFLQDKGDWPKAIVLDLWGSATMRTGGEEFAQALWLIGAKPKWDNQSARIAGFEILSLAALDRPRVDATLRISGLFRDLFPMQIALFDDAARAIGDLEEEDDDNPLAAARRLNVAPLSRIFGSSPGDYGLGLARVLAQGRWTDRGELGRAYIEASAYAYGRNKEGVRDAAGFCARVACADAYVHVQDLAERDLLESSEYGEYQGGFAAAAAALGAAPRLYHVDAGDPTRQRVRSLREAFARTFHARAINPRWLRSRMRHGYRGAADIAELVDNIFAFAALSDVVASRHFDRLFEAICAADDLRSFLSSQNPRAAQAIAEKFDEARHRRMWRPLRNSFAPILAEMKGAT